MNRTRHFVVIALSIAHLAACTIEQPTDILAIAVFAPLAAVNKTISFIKDPVSATGKTLGHNVPAYDPQESCAHYTNEKNRNECTEKLSEFLYSSSQSEIEAARHIHKQLSDKGFQTHDVSKHTIGDKTYRCEHLPKQIICQIK